MKDLFVQLGDLFECIEFARVRPLPTHPIVFECVVRLPSSAGLLALADRLAREAVRLDLFLGDGYLSMHTRWSRSPRASNHASFPAIADDMWSPLGSKSLR